MIKVSLVAGTLDAFSGAMGNDEIYNYVIGFAEFNNSYNLTSRKHML